MPMPSNTKILQVPFVDLKAHHEPLRAELQGAFDAVVTDSAFIRGKYAQRFEEEFAAFVGTRYCVGVGNGTDALFAALMAMGIGPGDEVITAANSFIATSEAISQTGADVVFVDCDPETFTIDIDRLQTAITSRTRAIIPVHLYGHPANMDKISAIADQHDLRVIEDAAQAHGAELNGKRIGTWGDCACFSFFPGKNLGAFGDAGAVVTDDDHLAERIRMFANHGRKSKYDHEFEGVNSRLDGLQAALLSVKLKHLDRWNARRREVAEMYSEGLAGHCRLPRTSDGAKHVFHLYVVRTLERQAIQDQLKQNGISTGVHYPIPLPFLQAYRHLGITVDQIPVTAGMKDQILSLPIHGELRDDHLRHVIDCFKQAAEQWIKATPA